MRFRALLAATLALPLAAQAQTPAGWTLTLNWSPQLCSADLSSKEPQCTEERYFELGGLSPQFSQATPECSGESLPEETRERMLRLVPDRTVLRKLWRRQGACSGMTMEEYFVQLDRAHRRLQIPAPYRQVRDTLEASSAAIRAEFIKANPGLAEDAISLRCSGRWLREVSVCLDADFGFRSCGSEIEDRCKEPVKLREVNPNVVLPERN